MSLPLSAHHHSSTQADRWFQLAQLQVISCSLVCLWNASGVPLRTLRTHFRALSSLSSIRTNGLPACCQLGEGKKKKSNPCSCGLSVFHSSTEISCCPPAVYSKQRGKLWKVNVITSCMSAGKPLPPYFKTISFVSSVLLVWFWFYIFTYSSWCANLLIVFVLPPLWKYYDFIDAKSKSPEIWKLTAANDCSVGSLQLKQAAGETCSFFS